jgi:hypothetical protein
VNYEFFNAWHLGDALFQCLYFQRVAPLHREDQFTLYCQLEHIGQLAETVEHLPNVFIRPMESKTTNAIDCWIGAGGYWHSSQIRNDYLGFYIDWFRRISALVGLSSPFTSKADFWFDYPALLKETQLSAPYDFLVVNAAPKSGQFNFNPSDMERLIETLVQKGHKVISTNPSSVKGVPCTFDHGISITGIGNIARQCTYHLMVSTGPSWTTFNVGTADKTKLRLILLDYVKLDYSPTCHHFGHVQTARNFLIEQKLL